MRPSVVLLGLLLGVAASITFSLLGVTIVVLLLQSEYPRLARELQPLVVNLGIFSVLTAAAALSFYGQLRRAPWRRLGAGAVLLVLIAVVGHYWPS